MHASVDLHIIKIDRARGNIMDALGQENMSIRRYNIFSKIVSLVVCKARLLLNMSATIDKHAHERDDDGHSSKVKMIKTDDNLADRLNLSHGKGRPIPRNVIEKLSKEDMTILEEVKSSCTNLQLICASFKIRLKHRLCLRLPEDDNDSSYYIEDGLRKVYPYPYLYQSYAKQRWRGRKLKDVLKQEFRDIAEDQLRLRFDMKRVLVNGEVASYDHVIHGNDFVSNLNHRHELPVLATPIKIIYSDKDTLVIDKPPSLPIHPCGRYRHNSVINILRKEYNYDNIKVVHRLDRLVSGVLIIARNTMRANALEKMIGNRDVQKEYVCRVEGEFPLGEDGKEIIVDQPLEIIPGKIGITVVHPKGKPSVTTFKRLNYNGKTSAVLCRPKTGRMHQIRVHLQYLGHPIVNDILYNSSVFGPEKGKGGHYGKNLAQLSRDVTSQHRADCWLISEDNDVIDLSSEIPENKKLSTYSNDVAKFVSKEEREETTEAIQHYFTSDSWKELEQKYRFDASKMDRDTSCRDCNTNYHDPPLRRLFLYLHALRYTGAGWSYESEMPVWAGDGWKY